MPYFGQSTKVTSYVRQLLVIFHGGFLWLDKLYSFDVDLISAITRLPRAQAYLVSVLEKDKYPTHIAKVKDKYDLVRSGGGFSISSISDLVICTATTILSYKVLQVLMYM